MDDREAFETDYDFRTKYTTRNFVARRLVDGFYRELGGVLSRTEPQSALEVGCGEGFSTARIRAALPPGSTLQGSDVEPRLVRRAREHNPEIVIEQESVYALKRDDDSFDLVICLEVLEHLDDPEAAMRELCRVAGRWLVVSVPREPLWRVLNMARLHFVRHLGNTPGHVQHWSRAGFVRFVEQFAAPLVLRSPIPWTIVLARPHGKDAG